MGIAPSPDSGSPAKGGSFPHPTRLQYLVCGKVGTTEERQFINDHRAGDR